MKTSRLSLIAVLVAVLLSVTACALASEPIYEPEFRTVSLESGITLRYAVLGDASKPSVVLIHGATDSYISYSQLAPILVEQGYAVYVPELRGHGGSSKPEEGPYTLEQHVNDMNAFIKALHIENTHVVGHSLGSFVAQALAAEHGDEWGIRGLTLIGTAASTVDNPVLTWMLYGDDETFPGVGAFTSEVPDAFIQEWVMSDNADPDFTLHTYRHAASLPVHSWKHTFFGLENVDNTPLLEKITCPVQIIWGTMDAFFSLEDQNQVVAALTNSPRVDFVTFEGISHNTHWDDGMAEKVSEAIVTFVEAYEP